MTRLPMPAPPLPASTPPARSIARAAARRRPGAALATVLLVAALFAAASPAPAQESTVAAEERVTAIDVLLTFDRPGTLRWASGRAVPAGLDAGDFEVRLDGEVVPVVGVGALEDSEAGRGAWRQLVWIDCRMASTPLARRAAAALQARAADLVALGEVAVVVADPVPSTLLPATRDAGRLEDVLSQLASTRQCRDELAAVRDELLRGLADLPAAEREERVRAALAGERAAVHRSLLGLAEHVSDELRLGGGAQNVVYLVHAGFDPDAAAFYRRHLDDVEAPAVPRFSTDALGRVLAAYGQVVVAFGEAPPAIGADGGAHIGSWYFSGAAPQVREPDQPELEVERIPGQVVDTGDPWEVFLGGIKARFKEQRDPGKAEGYLELGQALYGQGKYEQAEDALRQALYHFADHPKTRDRQAAVWVVLGNTLAARDERDLARKAVEQALTLDPGLAETGVAVDAALEARHATLEALAETTTGFAVDDAEGLGRALEGLNRKARLTYQVSGLPDGKLRPLTVRYRGDAPVHHPAWARSATPEAVAEARLLALVDEDLGDVFDLDHGLAVADAVGFDDASGERRASLDLRALGGDLSPSVRLSMAWGNLDEPAVIEHRLLDDDARDGTIDLGWPGEAGWMAILVEDLDSGRWGVHLFDL